MNDFVHKNGDHIVEIAELGLFCDYCFITNMTKIKLPWIRPQAFFKGRKL